MKVELEGQVALVTGAAQGIGRAVALRLAGQGARLALWDVKPEGLAETAELCRAQGVEVLTAKVDMGAAGDVVAAAEAVAPGTGWMALAVACLTMCQECQRLPFQNYCLH